MIDLKAFRKETEEFVERHEKKIADKYMDFLREVAKYYIAKGNRVFFKENTVIHYSEGGFGLMLIECDDDEIEVLGNYILEIRFVPRMSKKDIDDYIEIKKENLEDIKYELRGSAI